MRFIFKAAALLLPAGGGVTCLGVYHQIKGDTCEELCKKCKCGEGTQCTQPCTKCPENCCKDGQCCQGQGAQCCKDGKCCCKVEEGKCCCCCACSKNQ
ncbi:hypothetical protein MHLP_03850 [Candidatus Mycoplasma haematolamae str. Purdue]|uniref:Uncharacterized protein n=1 Tax=Mycoplasma haematolamae (strain Purdue) TaxID=1212765 RepID=I7BAK8_MYCHA|nr:hypothetical protein [Candidatus Mycoplasma haematolamae]AFO52350.1 hypothetical protein MHLP_03850 [Candidatus Mycoplasma haematolamae str. Purdue]